MNNIPRLDELLNYGDEYQYPNLITSDYFRKDNSKKNNSQEQEQQNSEQPQEQEQQSAEQSQEQEQQSAEQSQELEQQSAEQSQEQEQQTVEQSQEQEQQSAEQSQEQEQQNSEQSQEQEQQSVEQSQELEQQTKDENDFDDLMEYYDNNNSNNKTSECKTPESPSDKLDDISTTRIYKVFRKLVSLSYERYQKGTYRYNKKEIVKHYLTSQKFRIIDDLVSPTFKPDVYVFDLSPSNNKSLEMYVNAISSVAAKNSLIYLTYNDCILRKLVIKKENSQGIDVSKVANSQVEKYNNFDCTIFTEYRSLYEELRDIKDRKIYIFSDFDISFDISRLSQENPSIVWFSTEKNNYGDLNYNNYFYREYPSTYIGYYVETSGIDEIEKFILEKNKSKYKRKST